VDGIITGPVALIPRWMSMLRQTGFSEIAGRCDAAAIRRIVFGM
jgi:hypothetical protein